MACRCLNLACETLVSTDTPARTLRVHSYRSVCHEYLRPLVGDVLEAIDDFNKLATSVSRPRVMDTAAKYSVMAAASAVPCATAGRLPVTPSLHQAWWLTTQCGLSWTELYMVDCKVQNVTAFALPWSLDCQHEHSPIAPAAAFLMPFSRLHHTPSNHTALPA